MVFKHSRQSNRFGSSHQPSIGMAKARTGVADGFCPWSVGESLARALTVTATFSRVRIGLVRRVPDHATGRYAVTESYGMNFESVCSCGAKAVTTAKQWKRGTLRPKCSKCGATLETKGKGIQRPSPPRKPPRRRKPSLKQGCRVAIEGLAEIQEKASEFGIEVTAKKVKGRGKCRDTIHVMFNADGWRIVDYWPGNGTLMIGGTTGTKEKAPSMQEALERAIHAKGVTF